MILRPNSCILVSGKSRNEMVGDGYELILVAMSDSSLRAVWPTVVRYAPKKRWFYLQLLDPSVEPKKGCYGLCISQLVEGLFKPRCFLKCHLWPPFHNSWPYGTNTRTCESTRDYAMVMLTDDRWVGEVWHLLPIYPSIILPPGRRGYIRTLIPIPDLVSHDQSYIVLRFYLAYCFHYLGLWRTS